MTSVKRVSPRKYLGPIAGQENVADTFLRIEHKIDPNMFTGPTGTRCIIPIHDPVSLDGELTHPCVVYTPEKWNGYYYWMAVTPYKDSIDSYEDPNIVASNDGINWEVPAGLTNPLDDAPGGTKYNSDTHLVFGPNNVLYLFWRYLDISGESPGAEENMYVRTSTDGRNWTPKRLVHQTDQTVERLLSPSFEYYEGKWHMFAVSIVGTKRVVYKTSTDLTPGSWTTAVNCTVTLPAGRYPWHLFVTRVADQWVGLLNDSSNVGNSGQDGDLILMTSDVGNESVWNVSAQACVPRADTGFTRQYRSCFVPKVVNGMWGFDLWHSVWNPKYIYRTALTSTDYRPNSYAQFGRVGLGGPAGTRRLRLTDTAPELEFVESDNADKTWHIGVNSGAWKVTETGVQDRLLLAPSNSSYGMRLNVSDTGSAGNTETFLLNPTYNHTGTRAWTAQYINVVDNSTSSGAKLISKMAVNGATKFSVNNNGAIQIGTDTPPATATSAGTKGQIAYDDNYIYICTATNTWKRTALSSW